MAGKSPGTKARGLAARSSKVCRGDNMKRLLVILTILTIVGLLCGSSLMAAPHEMTDVEMDAVTGGNAPPIDPSSDQAVTSDSNPVVINSTSINNSINTITLSDQAQQNMTSMVNIFSINSSVEVMLNLNVSINSTVGTVNQGNIGTQSSTQTAIVP
jgi:hypothetical protein